MDRLRVWRPSLAPRVTEHVPHIIAFTQGIMDRGLAYVAEDGGCWSMWKEGEGVSVFVFLQKD